MAGSGRVWRQAQAGAWWTGAPRRIVLLLGPRALGLLDAFPVPDPAPLSWDGLWISPWARALIVVGAPGW